MGGVGEMLQRKFVNVPVWVWALMGTTALFLYLRHRKAAAGAAGGAAGDSAQAQPYATADSYPIGQVPGSVYSPTTMTSVVVPPGPGEPKPIIPGGSTGFWGHAPWRGLYTVQKGDTWASIAAKYHVATNVMIANNLAHASHPLYVGEKVNVPSPQSAPAPRQVQTVQQPHIVNVSQGNR
jgi:hypothetical protein